MLSPVLDPASTAKSRYLATALAVVAWSAVLLQFWLSLRLALLNGKSLWDGVIAYFGFFTVITNVFAALILTTAAGSNQARKRGPLSHPQWVACAAISITVVGIGYHLLLRHIWNPQGLQWVADMLLHYVVPCSLCLFWLFMMPKVNLPWWSPLLWCAYPVLYFAYVLVRGLFVGSYPYPFIDVTSIGYLQTALNVLGLLAAFIAVGSVLLAVKKRRGHATSKRNGG